MLDHTVPSEQRGHAYSDIAGLTTPLGDVAVKMDNEVGLELGMTVDPEFHRSGFGVGGLSDEIGEDLGVIPGQAQVDDLKGLHDSAKCALSERVPVVGATTSLVIAVVKKARSSP